MVLAAVENNEPPWKVRMPSRHLSVFPAVFHTQHVRFEAQAVPAYRGLDFQDGRHDHRLTPVGLAHPFADGAAHRLSDPERIGDLLGRE
jgi:hypothetical protein